MLSLIVLLFVSLSLMVVSVSAPWVLCDKNTFLLNFVNHEMLGFLGITVTITLASGATLFLDLNKMEEKIGKNIFKKSKLAIRNSCYCLIILLAASVVLVTIKPLTPDTEICRSLFNSMALIIVFANIGIMFDITSMVFQTGNEFE
ncbi:hypothetical protein [Gluconacetobacter asukensis]|uniref:Uncharacterized protein n=1 Tax=Gluconacetobacter asukensis TaxID=1017181 RepID=A0A7W4J3V2_9PROT|nr:hypothetical protein [Gluconacetobacter asukensis]MBB2174228.1 hypothetical protein [Gluconacetobacter asukensis]